MSHRGRVINFTPSEQGYRWREAGGLLSGCWYAEGTAQWALWRKGWKQRDAEIASEHSPASPTEEKPDL